MSRRCPDCTSIVPAGRTFCADRVACARGQSELRGERYLQRQQQAAIASYAAMGDPNSVQGHFNRLWAKQEAAGMHRWAPPGVDPNPPPRLVCTDGIPYEPPSHPDKPKGWDLIDVPADGKSNSNSGGQSSGAQPPQKQQHPISDYTRVVDGKVQYVGPSKQNRAIAASKQTQVQPPPPPPPPQSYVSPFSSGAPSSYSYSSVQFQPRSNPPSNAPYHPPSNPPSQPSYNPSYQPHTASRPPSARSPSFFSSAAVAPAPSPSPVSSSSSSWDKYMNEALDRIIHEESSNAPANDTSKQGSSSNNSSNSNNKSKSDYPELCRRLRESGVLIPSRPSSEFHKNLQMAAVPGLDRSHIWDKEFMAVRRGREEEEKGSGNTRLQTRCEIVAVWFAHTWLFGLPRAITCCRS
jgi:hypothetical protein